MDPMGTEWMFVLVPLVLFFSATCHAVIRQEAGMDESYFRWSQSLGCNSVEKDGMD